MILKKPMLHLTAAVAVTATRAFAVTVLYYDDFSGASTDALHGTTPDTTIATNTWSAKNTANTTFRADGSIAGTSGTAAQNTGSAYLSFTPTVGYIYTLDVRLSQPTGTSAAEWAGIGFSNSLTIDNSHNVAAPNGGMPWMLWRNNAVHTDMDDVEAYIGRAAFPSGGAASVDYTGTRTLTIKLDTTGPAWKAEWLVDGASFHTYTYEAAANAFQNFGGNPTINQVSVSRSRFTQPVFDSISLTQAVPEPRAGLLGGLGLLALLRRRR
jgi:hypothetical protein